MSWGGPDLVFRNDLRHGILITTSYTDQTLTFTFWGTPQGRRIVAETGPKVDFKAPTMAYAIDPSAPAGSVKVVSGSGAEGFSVTVQRTVYEHGKVLRRDSFHSTYIPDGATTVYGPGRPSAGPVLRAAEGLAARPRARARSGARSRRARPRPPLPGRS